jgi:glycosyltransferase involved in cell wall biosynthesis
MTVGGRTPRVALFTDSYAEANGIARLSRALETNAARHGRPFLCVHGGEAFDVVTSGSIERVELPRSAVAFRLEHDLRFDPLLWRHYGKVRDLVMAFRPDIVHITGPSDVGQLGALLGHRHDIPIVGSWHTNLHQYARLRSMRWCRWLPAPVQRRVLPAIERHALRATLYFYQIPRVLMAPNQELVTLLAARTGKPTHLMKHGVDCGAFTPAEGQPRQGTVRIGFVGRLSAEKRVRLLPILARTLRANGVACEFVFVGDGSERPWLEREMPEAHFHGVLAGEDLARAYRGFDLFVFPSPSETFGLAVLEAMASGVAVLAMAQGGPGFVIEHGVSGWLARDEQDFLDSGLRLARDGDLRARLGRGARARALAWSWDTVSDELYDIYRETMKQAG